MSFAIYVSKNDPASIEALEKELNLDRNYSVDSKYNIPIRTRLATEVICSDCNSLCTANPLPLGSNTPLAVICRSCNYVYYHSDNSRHNNNRS